MPVFVRNYKSYRTETTFDFQAASIPEFSETLLADEKGGALLPVGVIYGPNGGGKTNLLLALSCLISTVVKPIHDLEKSRQDAIIQHKVGCMPFLFDEDSGIVQRNLRYIFGRKKMNIDIVCRC